MLAELLPAGAQPLLPLALRTHLLHRSLEQLFQRGLLYFLAHQFADGHVAVPDDVALDLGSQRFLEDGALGGVPDRDRVGQFIGVCLAIAEEGERVGLAVSDVRQWFLWRVGASDDLVLLFVGVVDLPVEKQQLFLEFLALRDEEGEFALVVLALAAEEHVGLDEFVALLLELLLPLDHLVLDLLLVGVGLELVELLLRLDQLLLVLLDQLCLLLVEVVVQLHVQLLDQTVQVGLCLLNILKRVFGG